MRRLRFDLSMNDGSGGHGNGGGGNGFSGELSPPSGRPGPPAHPNSGFAPLPPDVGPPVYYGAQKQHPLAIISIACGAAAFPLSCCCSYFASPLPIVAIVCGILALGKIRANPEMFTGRPQAIGGIALGGIGFLIYAGMIAMYTVPALSQKLVSPIFP